MSTTKLSNTELCQLFREFIAAEYVISDAETMRPYECDGLAMYCEMPIAVLLPETVEQLQQVLQM